MPERKSVLIVGYGGGLGLSLARAFGSHGYAVTGLARTAPAAAAPPNTTVVTADATDAVQVQAVVDTMRDEGGGPSVLIHNTAELVIKPFLETSEAEFERVWRSMVLSAVIASQAVLPGMLHDGGGAILVSGATASLRGGANFSAFASAKFALRGLTQSLARAHQKQGVHVAHVILDGIIWSERSRALHGVEKEACLDPDDIARAYRGLVEQPKSAWTHELDLRPSVEGF